MSPAMPLAAEDCRTLCAAPRTIASTPRNIARLRDFLIRDFVIAPTIALQLRGAGLTLIGGARPVRQFCACSLHRPDRAASIPGLSSSPPRMCSALSALAAGLSWLPWRFRECDERHEALSLAHSNRTHKVSAWRSHFIG